MFLTLSASQKTQVLEDFRTHISYLQESLATRSGALFFDYTCWIRAFNLQLHLPGDYLVTEYTALNEVLSQELPPITGVNPMPLSGRVSGGWISARP